MVGAVVVVPDATAVFAVDRASGRPVWRRDMASEYTMTVAGDLIVLTESKLGLLDVVDAATGATRWRLEQGQSTPVVYRDAVYLVDCQNTSVVPRTGCAVTARNIRDGAAVWTTPGTTYSITQDAVGARPPYAPVAGAYLAASVDQGETPFGLVETATGRVLAGRIRLDGWYELAVGKQVVGINNDPPSGDGRCTVRVVAFDGVTGAAAWSAEVFSGRDDNGGCHHALGPSAPHGFRLIGGGTRIAAVTDSGLPQLFDLATGAAMWTATQTGVPVDGDDRCVLVRDHFETGGLRLLDAATGAVRWSAPDPGMSFVSASWETSVTGRLVAITGVKEGRLFVLVYDLATGRRLGRFPSWLSGAGDDWVAVNRSTHGTHGVLDFIELRAGASRYTPASVR